jgi:hypothetical protein
MVLMVSLRAVAAGLAVLAILFEARVGPHTSLRITHGYYIAMGAGVALFIGLVVITRRRMPGMYSIQADRSGFSLADRVHRNVQRYRLGQALGDANHIVMGLLQMALVVVIAYRDGLHGLLRWIALGLVAVPVVAVIAHRMSLRSLRPALGQSLSDVLALSIRHAQSQARRTAQVWWQVGLSLVGIFLGMEPQWLENGTVRPSVWVLLVMCLAIPALMRAQSKKTVRRLLQPQVEELEGLRASLTEREQPGPPHG